LLDAEIESSESDQIPDVLRDELAEERTQAAVMANYKNKYGASQNNGDDLAELLIASSSEQVLNVCSAIVGKTITKVRSSKYWVVSYEQQK
jgi:hypothetical protein